jgi:hypothetical protein
MYSEENDQQPNKHEEAEKSKKAAIKTSPEFIATLRSKRAFLFGR